MSKISVVLLAGLCVASSAQAATVGVGTSGAAWNGYMNVFDLGGNYQWGSAWGIPDLCANFNDVAHTLTLSSNSINDADPYWYIGGGGPGHAGNKIMEANLYVESTDVYNGQTLTFQGNVLSNTFNPAHKAIIFIRDFAADYSSFNQTVADLTPGAFSISLACNAGAGRHVQYGFQVKGVDVWVTDTGLFGNAVIETVPQPASLALIGLGGLAAGRRRRA